MHAAAPEQLPRVLADSGAVLGVQVTAFLVDYEQRTLVPVLPPETRREPLDVDTTLAGRAFRRVETLPSQAGGSRLWVPLLDGVERLGVLEVVVDRADDVHDPVLREQCGWLARLAGHLITAVTGYGDGLDVLRRSRPRTPAAELIWQLLPPLTAATPDVEVAGLSEPTHSVGGDAFDYALSERSAALAIFDAAGHSLLSGTVVAAALSAYRAARRSGLDIEEQARAVDATVSDLFGRTQCFVSAVIAELDTTSGTLRYLNAGHPPPLISRDGRVVKTLADAHHPVFGISTGKGGFGHSGIRVAQEVLQGDDWIVLYTDGLVEARNRRGEFFGHDRLVDLLCRETAVANPPPEALRRLMHAVLEHQEGVLQDDATVVLTRWIGR
jgi:hypothetical protein